MKVVYVNDSGTRARAWLRSNYHISHRLFSSSLSKKPYLPLPPLDYQLYVHYQGRQSRLVHSGSNKLLP